MSGPEPEGNGSFFAAEEMQTTMDKYHIFKTPFPVR
jgi:hypothetical protein